MALSTYNRKKQFIAPEVEALIKELTGFEEDEDNYQKVSRFAYSNIIHHNFSTVDISVVQRSVNGIIEKFKLSGFADRSQRLRDLVDKFINSESTKFTEPVKWDILLLLLQLSFKPLSVSSDELKKKEDLNFSIVKEDIDWSSYLKEGAEEFTCPSDDSDEEAALWASSEDEEEEDAAESDQSALDVGYEPKGFGCVPHPSLWGKQSPPLTRHEAIRKIILEGVEAEKWLRSNVQNSWWVDPTCNVVPTSRYPVAYTCEKWEKHVAAKIVINPDDLPIIQKLSEFNVLHEVLWMLQTPMDMRVFLANSDGLFYVRPNISLASVIPESFRQYLTQLCPYFDMMRRLRQFEEQVWAQELSDDPPPATYKSYCNMLFLLLHPFFRLLGTIENRLNSQDETMTLITVVDELTPSLDRLRYLHDLHTQAVTELGTKPNWVCVTRLLSVLYKAVVEATDPEHFNVSLNLFMQSFHIYINIIDVWLSEGRLEDWGNEFLVTRKNGILEVMPYGEMMRECGVEPVPLLSRLVSVVRDAGTTIEVVGQLNKLSELRSAVQNKGCLYKEFSENVYNVLKRLKGENHHEIQKIPSNSEFVSANSSVQDIVEEQKAEPDKAEEKEKESQSEDVGQSQGDNESKKADDDVLIVEVNDVKDEDNCVENSPNDNDMQKPILDDEICDRLCGLPVGMGVGEGEGKIEDKDPRWYLLSLNSKHMYKHVMNRLLENPLLRAGLQQFLEPHRPPSPLQSRSLSPIMNHSAGIIAPMSLHSVLEQQLELIVTRHRLASKIVTHTLRTEHSLLQHFTVLRNVYFMASGNLAQSFYSFLFEEIELGGLNNHALDTHLKLCVEEHYPRFGDYFSIDVGQASSTRDVHRAISFISLHYKVFWPISSIIVDEAIDSYNKIFRFLLHIKYAHWTLRNICSSDLAGSESPVLCRRLQALRHWLYHSINTLHSYFMGLVLRSFSLHLEQSIQSAESVQVIMQAHNTFLDEAKVHCLQDKKTHVETFIMKLLRLCGALASSWQQEAQGCLTEQDTRALEKQYVMSCNGLLYCLEAVAEEADPDNYLWELKCEIAQSMPDHYS